MKLVYSGFIYEAVYSNGKYDVDRIKQDNIHEFRIVDGVKYRIHKGLSVETININLIEQTNDNEFYEDHIERYVEYIQKGGIIEPFPVEVSKLASTLEDMLEFLDTNEEFSDEIYQEFKDNGIPGLKIFGLSYLLTDNNEGEDFWKYRRIYRKANSLNSVYKGEPTEEEKTILPFLEKVFQFFEENAEYTLINQNHRLEALKRLNKKIVLISK